MTKLESIEKCLRSFFSDISATDDLVVLDYVFTGEMIPRLRRVRASTVGRSGRWNPGRGALILVEFAPASRSRQQCTRETFELVCARSAFYNLFTPQSSIAQVVDPVSDQ